MSQIHVLTFRDESRMEPRQLVAFEDQDLAGSTRDALQERFRQLWSSRQLAERVNRSWHDLLAERHIPEERWFDIDTQRHSNIAFEIKELELIESHA